MFDQLSGYVPDGGKDEETASAITRQWLDPRGVVA
jgi:hypothetical protein